MSKPEELEGPPTVDSLPASALSERGNSYDDRQLMSELNKKKDWDGLLRFAQKHGQAAANRSVVGIFR